VLIRHLLQAPSKPHQSATCECIIIPFVCVLFVIAIVDRVNIGPCRLTIE
jgi:hypothetical protein